jgi:uncharacterized protein YfdQ (DUF2303 family)
MLEPVKETLSTTEAPQPFDFAAAFKLGSEKIVQKEVNGHPVLVIPQHMKVETLNELVEQYREKPLHLTQGIEALSIESFIDYYNHWSSPYSAIFFNPEKGHFKAILDYHQTSTEPSFKRHVITYDCPRTKEWNDWIASNNVKMTQVEFALFIEDNLRQITEPEAAQMLEIACSLKASTDVDFKSSTRLADGQVQFGYVEKINGQAGATGQLQIPEIITLNLQPFLKGAPYVVRARFRYRVSSGGLTMWYTLITPHLSFQDAIDEVATKVKENMIHGHLFQAKCN